MNEEDNSLNSVLNDGHPLQEFIVAFDFDYCDVSYEGYRILSRDEISKLSSQLEKDCEVGTLNMPGSWYEEFHISELDGAFTIYSSDSNDIAKMRDLFGESAGHTGYFDLILYNLEDSSDEEAGAEISHITKEVAEQFLEDDSIDLSEATGIDDDAAELLSTYSGDLCLWGITKLTDAAAQALANHQGGFLGLDGLTDVSELAMEALARHRGGLHLSRIESISDDTAEAFAQHQGDLNLRGLTKISDTAAAALTKHKGRLDLGGLTELSNGAANSLAKHDGFINFVNLKSVPLAIATHIASHGQDESVDLDELEALSEELAAALAGGNYHMLTFAGLTDVAESALIKLENYQGFLGFHGITQITSQTAAIFSQLNAQSLCLGVTSLDDECCKALSNFKGELNLDFLEEVSPIGAKWLLEQGNMSPEYCGVDLEQIADQL